MAGLVQALQKAEEEIIQRDDELRQLKGEPPVTHTGFPPLVLQNLTRTIFFVLFVFV